MTHHTTTPTADDIEAALEKMAPKIEQGYAEKTDVVLPTPAQIEADIAQRRAQITDAQKAMIDMRAQIVEWESQIAALKKLGRKAMARL